MANKRILTCAITGSSHTPTMNNDIPMTVEEHIDDAVASHAAGAAVIHVHARDPDDGHPVSDVGMFREYCSGIKERCDAVISITTGGATGQTIEERLNVIKVLKPELATCNLGTMNYGLFQMIPKPPSRAAAARGRCVDPLRCSASCALAHPSRALKRANQTLLRDPSV